MKGNLRASWRRALFALAFALLLATIAGPTHAQTPSPQPEDQTFGVIESYEDPTAAGRLGATWTRVRFQWAEVQAEGPESWAPPLDDETLDAEIDAGRMVVGLIIGIPEWARDHDGLPRGLSLPPDDAGNTWATFVREIVGRYEGRIDHWIIWNEPDIDDDDAPGHTWDGTIEDFVQLQRTAYLVAKDTNPDAIIHLGAFTYFWDPGYFRRFLDLVATDPAAVENDFYFDIATAHLYFQPNFIYTIIDVFHKVMATHDLDKPIWLVETNAPPMDDPYWDVPNWTLAVSLNEQAAFIPQALAAALAAGAERIAVYKLKDTEGDREANPEPFGLIRWDESRRPAYNTYRVAIRLLAGVTAAERERWDAVGQIRLDQDGQSTTVLFARLPQSQTARVPATAATADWIDMWGKAETIEAKDGYFEVELPGALCLQTIADFCMIGGTTYYLVQSAAGKPVVTPTRAVTLTPRPTTTATSAPSPQPSVTPRPANTLETIVQAPQPTATAVSSTAVRSTPNPEPAAVSVPESSSARWLADYAGLLVTGTAIILGAVMWGVHRTRTHR
jgi:hypothetical protein